MSSKLRQLEAGVRAQGEVVESISGSIQFMGAFIMGSATGASHIPGLISRRLWQVRFGTKQDGLSTYFRSLRGCSHCLDVEEGMAGSCLYFDLLLIFGRSSEPSESIQELEQSLGG